MKSLHYALLGTLLVSLGIGCSKPSAADERVASTRREARRGDGASQDDRSGAEKGTRHRTLHWLWVQDDHDDRDANDDGENDEGDKE
ncbi:hypothetical protein OV079_23560 [Nannocystis pusilla]|uniref:Lipoprotein n=1 Tax=Nannocystis pusilla TaxID=889268 RepID=A0A9X3ERF0_9BACT|nr:hypothetical protein [Nannocystis pusilla]MCY1008480.1 hypothetical protein [Nannocystis pusilla]